MKKLISLMIGLGLVLGTTAAVFAQDTTKSDTSKKSKSKKKKGDTTKKDGPSSH
ncbi:MAG TPA: hypothetical protein VML19_32115 [Verrucomicrobiae bacterium]|nr:hypothetical protein [Verrucomicrobiae bacterium]